MNRASKMEMVHGAEEALRFLEYETKLRFALARKDSRMLFELLHTEEVTDPMFQQLVFALLFEEGELDGIGWMLTSVTWRHIDMDVLFSLLYLKANIKNLVLYSGFFSCTDISVLLANHCRRECEDLLMFARISGNIKVDMTVMDNFAMQLSIEHKCWRNIQELLNDDKVEIPSKMTRKAVALMRENGSVRGPLMSRLVRKRWRQVRGVVRLFSIWRNFVIRYYSPLVLDGDPKHTSKGFKKVYQKYIPNTLILKQS